MNAKWTDIFISDTDWRYQTSTLSKLRSADRAPRSAIILAMGRELQSRAAPSKRARQRRVLSIRRMRPQTKTATGKTVVSTAHVMSRAPSFVHSTSCAYKRAGERGSRSFVWKRRLDRYASFYLASLVINGEFLQRWSTHDRRMRNAPAVFHE